MKLSALKRAALAAGVVSTTLIGVTPGQAQAVDSLLDKLVDKGVLTPKEATEKFTVALNAALKDPTVGSRLAELGAVVVSDDKLTPAGLQTWLQAELLRYGPVIKAAGQFAD